MNPPYQDPVDVYPDANDADGIGLARVVGYLSENWKRILVGGAVVLPYALGQRDLTFLKFRWV